MWSLEPGGVMLRLGSRRLPLGDVTGFDYIKHRARDRHGRIVGALVFAVLCAIVMVGVFGFGWRERYLIAVVFLAMLSLTALGDVLHLNQIRYLELRIRTRRGETVPFVVADQAEADALAGLLMERGVPVGPSR
jgi:hypothetical protein